MQSTWMMQTLLVVVTILTVACGYAASGVHAGSVQMMTIDVAQAPVSPWGESAGNGLLMVFRAAPAADEEGVGSRR